MKLTKELLTNLQQAIDQGADVFVEDHAITIEWPETIEGYDDADEFTYLIRKQFAGDRRYVFAGCIGCASLYIREKEGVLA